MTVIASPGQVWIEQVFLASTRWRVGLYPRQASLCDQLLFSMIENLFAINFIIEITKAYIKGS